MTKRTWEWVLFFSPSSSSSSHFFFSSFPNLSSPHHFDTFNFYRNRQGAASILYLPFLQLFLPSHTLGRTYILHISFVFLPPLSLRHFLQLHRHQFRFPLVFPAAVSTFTSSTLSLIWYKLQRHTHSHRRLFSSCTWNYIINVRSSSPFPYKFNFLWGKVFFTFNFLPKKRRRRLKSHHSHAATSPPMSGHPLTC